MDSLRRVKMLLAASDYRAFGKLAATLAHRSLRRQVQAPHATQNVARGVPKGGYPTRPPGQVSHQAPAGVEAVRVGSFSWACACNAV
jgi:hypothetical protein